MKGFILCFLAFIGTFSNIQAQSKKELTATLSKNLADYRNYTLAGDFDHSLQYMPPKMYEIVPFDSLKQIMISSMDNEYMSIQMTHFDFDPKQKYKLKKAGVYYWTYVPYTGGMRLILKGEESFIQLVIPMMKSKFGSENVTMAADSIMDVALKNKKLLAFKDPKSSNWSLIEDKRMEEGEDAESQKALMESIVPAEVLKAVDKK